MTSIVDKTPAADAPHGDDGDALEAIHARLLDEQPRFLGSVDDGPEIYSAFGLAQVVHEIATEASADTVRELTGELGTASNEVHHLVGLLVASDERVDQLRAENDLLRAELHSREPVF